MKATRILAGLWLAAGTTISAGAQGQHTGEGAMIDAQIDFSGSYGTTVTDGSGVKYYAAGTLIGQEDKVYPAQYWGNFPLYFFDTTVSVSVRLTNRGPRQRAKVRVTTEAYVLRTDGSSGGSLAAPRVVEVDLERGESRTLDASFLVPYTPQAESGLDRFLVKVSHPNEGGGSGNADPALIMVKEGVFCPPRYRK